MCIVLFLNVHDISFTFYFTKGPYVTVQEKVQKYQIEDKMIIAK
jgi:hypothetical protein